MKGEGKRNLCLMIPTRFYVYIAWKKNLLLDRSYSGTWNQMIRLLINLRLPEQYSAYLDSGRAIWTCLACRFNHILLSRLAKVALLDWQTACVNPIAWILLSWSNWLFVQLWSWFNAHSSSFTPIYCAFLVATNATLFLWYHHPLPYRCNLKPKRKRGRYCLSTRRSIQTSKVTANT